MRLKPYQRGFVAGAVDFDGSGFAGDALCPENLSAKGACPKGKTAADAIAADDLSRLRRVH